MRSFYHDRLWTNIGEALPKKEDCRFLIQVPDQELAVVPQPAMDASNAEAHQLHAAGR